MGFTIAIAGIWAVVAVASVLTPTMVTGSDPDDHPSRRVRGAGRRCDRHGVRKRLRRRQLRARSLLVAERAPWTGEVEQKHQRARFSDQSVTEMWHDARAMLTYLTIGTRRRTRFMTQLGRFDPAFDFQTDATGRDPDSSSPTLKTYHKRLWSKPLPSGDLFELDDTTPGAYLHHESARGEFYLTSDSAVPTWTRWLRMAAVLQPHARVGAGAIPHRGWPDWRRGSCSQADG